MFRFEKARNSLEQGTGTTVKLINNAITTVAKQHTTLKGINISATSNILRECTSQAMSSSFEVGKQRDSAFLILTRSQPSNIC